jgi:hypothetical protein
MNVFTDDEACEFETKNAWASGLRISPTDDIFYDSEGASCFRLTYPETPRRVTYAARLLSMLGAFEGDESTFNGALLWLRLWEIGSPQLEKAGWKMIERMRMGYGELRPLGEANAHWFRSDEIAELAAFIVPCFVFGWDAYILPSGGHTFGFVSHDGFWSISARNHEASNRVLTEFAEFKPEFDLDLAARFCRGAGSNSPANYRM